MALDCEATASWLGSTICSAGDAAAPNLNCLESGERRQAPADHLRRSRDLLGLSPSTT